MRNFIRGNAERPAGKVRVFATTGLILVLLLIPVFDRSQYRIEVLTMAGIAAMLSLGLNVQIGYAGLLNLGFGALYAVGAYTYAMLNFYWGWPFWLCLPVSAFTGAAAGLVLGVPSLRLRGDYLAIVTLGFGEITRVALNNLRVTGGPDGLDGLAHPSWITLGRDGFRATSFGLASWPYYYLVLVLLGLLILVCQRLQRSRLGRAWMAVREDEVAASAMGVDTTWVKLLAFSIGSVFASLAGCVFASKQGAVSPESFSFMTSVMVVSMVVLGGLGSIAGAIVGAAVLTILPEFLRGLPAGFTTYRMVFFGAALVLIMLFRPEGLLGSRRRGMELRYGIQKARRDRKIAAGGSTA